MPDDDEPPGWAAVVRGGASPMAELFATVARDIDTLADRGVARIRVNVGEYAAVAPRERGGLWWSTKRNIASALVCLAEQRPLTRADLENQRLLGARAAERTIPLDSVMHAFRLGLIVLWDALREAADDLGPPAAAALLDAAGPMWLSLEHFSSALAAGHSDASAVQAEDSRRRVLAFVEGLRGLPGSAAEAADAARVLGIDPDGAFLWSAFAGSASAATSGADVAVVLDTQAGVLGLVTAPALAAGDEERLAAALVRGGARQVGVGLARSGLAGARLSLLDAEQAHAVAVSSGRPACLFRRDWLSCLLFPAATQLDALLAPAAAELSANADLRATVSVFLDEGGNLAAAGKRLHLHPNTVAYRLGRLADRTGIDVRTCPGMAQALVVLALLPPPP